MALRLWRSAYHSTAPILSYIGGASNGLFFGSVLNTGGESSHGQSPFFAKPVLKPLARLVKT